MVPDGFDGDQLVAHAYDRYSMSFGVGLGQLAGKHSTVVILAPCLKRKY